jgi:hypothetical protein
MTDDFYWLVAIDQDHRHDLDNTPEWERSRG